MNAARRTIAGNPVDRRLVGIAVSILFLDLVLIGLFLLWAVTSHYELRHIWIFGRDEFSMAEGQLTEQWGFLKLAVASVLLLTIAASERKLFLWGLAALVGIMLLSDSLQLHEQINNVLYPPLAAMLDRPHIDIFTKSALAAAPLCAMAFGLWSMSAADRRPMLWLAAPAVTLGFWTSVVDFVHGLFERHFDGGRTIGNLIEEGGESLLSTVVLVVALFYFRIWHDSKKQRSIRQSPILNRSLPPSAGNKR